MAAPAGNQFWKARSSHGRHPIFSSPEQLWESCQEYFEWVEANPLYEDKIISFQGVATHVPCAKMRAMTISGLCIFLDIARRSWDEYRSRQDFLPVCEQVEQVIRDQKFTGAAADLLNASIIARDLGLADRTELTGAAGGPIETANVTDIEAARRIAFFLESAAKDKA
jgi:hypothetical protein